MTTPNFVEQADVASSTGFELGAAVLQTAAKLGYGKFQYWGILKTQTILHYPRPRIWFVNDSHWVSVMDISYVFSQVLNSDTALGHDWQLFTQYQYWTMSLSISARVLLAKYLIVPLVQTWGSRRRLQWFQREKITLWPTIIAKYIWICADLLWGSVNSRSGLKAENAISSNMVMHENVSPSIISKSQQIRDNV